VLHQGLRKGLHEAVALRQRLLWSQTVPRLAESDGPCSSVLQKAGG
jgi:hypothetical protein